MDIESKAKLEISTKQSDILPTQVRTFLDKHPRVGLALRSHLAAAPLMDDCPSIAPIGLADYHIAKVSRVIDGDTIVAYIHLGFGVTIMESIRLAGIDAPEMCCDQKPAAEASRSALQSLCQEKIVVIKTWHGHEDKHGRPLAIVWLYDDTLSLNRRQLEAGHAVKYFGGKKTTNPVVV